MKYLNYAVQLLIGNLNPNIYVISSNQGQVKEVFKKFPNQ